MNFILALALFILVGSAVPGTMLSSPETLYDAGLGKHEPPPCRELTPGEAHERQLDKKGKAATYSIDGEFVCLHGIFNQGDRSAYLEFVVRQAPARAADAARAASRLVAERPELLHRPWAVEVITDIGDVRPHLKQVWEEALVSALGAGMVVRSRSANSEPILLVVRTRWVQDADLLFDVTASTAPGQIAGRL